MRIPETRYVTVDDVDVAYKVLGDGPLDLLYFAGLGSHIDVLWEHTPTAEFFFRLASLGRLIIFDRRGTGASGPLPAVERPMWEIWVDDVLAVLDATESASAAIFAEVDAGPTAILLAAMHPQRVQRLILANTTARYSIADDYPDGMTSETIDLIVTTIESSWGSPGSVRAVQPDADDALIEWSAKLLRCAATPRVAASQYEYILRTMDVRRALPLVHVPTLVLHSANHQLGSIEHGRRLAAGIEDAVFVELPAADAYFTTRGYRRVADEISAFLTGHAQPVEADRILTTVLFTDIVGSTARAASMGDRAWRELLDAHDRAVRDEIRRHHGRVINTTGDGFVVSFDSPTRAIRCGRAVTDAARRLGIDVRTGIHTGECEVRGDDLGGLAVHIAARVVQLASDGEVLTTSMVRDLVAGSGIEFVDRGEHELRGVPNRFTLHAVAPDA